MEYRIIEAMIVISVLKEAHGDDNKEYQFTIKPLSIDWMNETGICNHLASWLSYNDEVDEEYVDICKNELQKIEIPGDAIEIVISEGSREDYALRIIVESR